MIGVTIGTGPFAKLAHLAAETFRTHTGLPCLVLDDKIYEKSGLRFPHHLKYRMFDLCDADTIVYFDADLWWMRKWDPAQLVKEAGPEALVAVRDLTKAQHIVADAQAFDMFAEDYFNSGFMILHRHVHQRFLTLASNIYTKLVESTKYISKSKFKDQTSLNLSAQMAAFPVHFVDRRYNCVQEAGMWLRKGYPIIGAHKPRRRLPDDTRTDLQMWEDYMKEGMPVADKTINDSDFKALADVYLLESSGTQPGAQRVWLELTVDGVVNSSTSQECWWWPVRSAVNDCSIHLVGMDTAPKKKLDEVLMGVLKQISPDSWQGASLHGRERTIKLTRITN